MRISDWSSDVCSSDLMQLLDVVLGERDVLPRREHQFHQLGVAGHFLLVAAGESFDLQIRQQPLHLAVGQLAALDAGGGTDALDGGDPPQDRKSVVSGTSVSVRVVLGGGQVLTKKKTKK